MILNADLIQIIQEYLENTEAKKASLFGSFAKGIANESSDLDILIEFEPRISMLTFIKYKRELQELTGKKIDLQTPSSISPYIFPLIQKDLKLFYERK
jgi:hypothetical protein